MNVLVLTPNRTGSTLLQRMLTIFMLRRGFDKPVININEITNGIEKFIHPGLGQEVLGKSLDSNQWSYDQSLPEIVELFKQSDQYSVARLGYWHLPRRNDSVTDHAKFVEYFNNNFYIISTQRENLLEYALSWGIRANTGVLNAHFPSEKVDRFGHMYHDTVTISKQELIARLDDYKSYNKWVSTFFNVQSTFTQESVNDIENYILNLDFMKGAKNNTWKDMFGIDWQTWNKVHKTIPDTVINSVGQQGVHATITGQLTQDDWDRMRGPDWPTTPVGDLETANLPAVIKEEIKSMSGLPTITAKPEVVNFLKSHAHTYKQAESQIDNLYHQGYLPSGIPIKLQTFNEKKSIISNFDECVKWYNEWVDENEYGKTYEELLESIERQSAVEEFNFNDFSGYLTHDS
jgi:hypothetical protein